MSQSRVTTVAPIALAERAIRTSPNAEADAASKPSALIARRMASAPRVKGIRGEEKGRPWTPAIVREHMFRPRHDGLIPRPLAEPTSVGLKVASFWGRVAYSVLATGRMAALTRGVLTWAAIACGMAAMALAAPVDHDEGHFMAVAALAWDGRPFVDFLSLQTPLQAWLFAPIARLFAGHAFAALRIVTGLLGAGVLGVVYASQRRLGVEPRRAAPCTALLSLCYSAQFGCGLVRNDALPALLASGGMLASLSATKEGRRSPWWWGAAGLLLGAAASAKISYAVPLAAAGAFVCVRAWRGRTSIGAVAGLSVGAAIGLAPTVVAWRSAPDNFVYGVFTFAMTAPFEWYKLRDLGWRLRIEGKLWDTLVVLVRGPALGALVVVAAARIRCWRAQMPRRAEVALLDWLTLAGVVAALAPTPMLPQYALPLLPPLFVRLGIEPDGRRRVMRVAAVLMAAGVVVGLVTHGAILTRAARTGLPAATVTRQAHWIGERLRAARATGAIATLAPHIVLDSGYPLDPRFATGAFVYRTAGRLSDAELRRLAVVSPTSIGTFLDERPPAAIVIGYEGIGPNTPVDLDAPLRDYARARGYRSERSPFGQAELYVAPRQDHRLLGDDVRTPSGAAIGARLPCPSRQSLQPWSLDPWRAPHFSRSAAARICASLLSRRGGSAQGAARFGALALHRERAIGICGLSTVEVHAAQGAAVRRRVARGISAQGVTATGTERGRRLRAATSDWFADRRLVVLSDRLSLSGAGRRSAPRHPRTATRARSTARSATDPIVGPTRARASERQCDSAEPRATSWISMSPLGMARARSGPLIPLGVLAARSVGRQPRERVAPAGQRLSHCCCLTSD
jgi:hypothetical protein